MENLIAFREPQHFRLGWRIMGNLLPFPAAILIIGVTLGGLVLLQVFNAPRLFFLPIALGFVLYGLYEFLKPFFQGNAFLPRYFPNRGPGWLCQVTFTPRRYLGIEGVLEDADDFGVFVVQGDWLVFSGDSSYLSVHRGAIYTMELKNAGWRTMWLMGNSARVILKAPITNVLAFTIMPREGITLLQCHRTSRDFTDALKVFAGQSSLSPG